MFIITGISYAELTSRSHWWRISTSRHMFMSSMPVRSWNCSTLSVCSFVRPSASIFQQVLLLFWSFSLWLSTYFCLATVSVNLCVSLFCCLLLLVQFAVCFCGLCPLLVAKRMRNLTIYIGKRTGLGLYKLFNISNLELELVAYRTIDSIDVIGFHWFIDYFAAFSFILE